jgi:hypothetical protein
LNLIAKLELFFEKGEIMKKSCATILLLLIVLICFSKGEANVNFKDGSLRYDLEFVGNADTFWVVHNQTKILKCDVGNQVITNDNRDFGVFRFNVYDILSGKKIFQKGFSPIFQEWLQTPEAFKKNRSFYQALYIPMPVNDVIIGIDIRDVKNEWKNIYSDTIKLADKWIKCEKPTFYPVDTILFSGSSSEKIDIAILSDGYMLKELGKFKADARRMVDSLLNCVPYKMYRDRFNFYAINVPSVESGSDIPDQKVFKNTAFNTTWNTFESERYLTTFDLKSVSDAVDGISWDHLIILVNSNRYGGGGFYNFLSVSSADNVHSYQVFIHEFGHEFAGLGDEYFNNTDSLFASYKNCFEPWEPNLTTLVKFDQKWKNRVDPSTPIPTPRDSIYANMIGAFEGGGYLAKGVYSPFMTCWMKETAAGKFCPVCQEAIRQTILLQSK